MATAAQLVQVWEEGTGRDAAHSSRLTRAFQLAKKFPVGKHGKAALLTSSALTYFILADATGDGIVSAVERAEAWGGVVRDYRNGMTVSPGRSQAEAAWRAWRASVQGEAEAADSNAQLNILPGGTLLEGVAALLDRMSDPTWNVPLYGDSLRSFRELVSYLQFRIDLLVGGPEGPVAHVFVSGRSDRYYSQKQPPVARCPITSVITIEAQHLFILARVLETAKARTISASPVPPIPPASPAGPGNGNAGAVPTAPAPTPDPLSRPADYTAAHAHQDRTLNNPEPSAGVCGCARAAKGYSLSHLAFGASLDVFLADFEHAHAA